MKAFLVVLALEAAFVASVFLRTRSDNSDAAATAGLPRMLSLMLCVAIDFLWGVIALVRHFT